VLCVVPNRDRAAAEERRAGVALARRRAWYTSLAWRLERWGVAPLVTAARGHRARAADLLASLPGDPAAFAADLMLTPLFERVAAPLRIYTAHNVEQDHFRTTHPMGRSARWSAEVTELESRAAWAAALIVACTAEDAARFAELYGVPAERLAVAPNGWDDETVRAAGAEERRAARAALGFDERETVALFMGSDVPHNRAAARVLIERVMPGLAGAGFRLVVVGSVTRSLSAPRAPWLTLPGEVDDLGPWLDAADVGLNPVTAGGGSNVKLPTYLAAGLAVITTSFGLRGYPELEPHVTVASPLETAEALRARPRGWRRRDLAMPDSVAALSWGRIGEQLGERIEALLPGESSTSAVSVRG
jgi:hypothetical protein